MFRSLSVRRGDLRRVCKHERGFTLIELLVVVIIIGILASIAIPTFLAQRERAWEAAAQSDLRNAATAATSCSVQSDGSYAACRTEEELKGSGYNGDENVNFEPDESVEDDVWAATAVHENGGALFSFTTDADDPDAGQIVRR